MAVSTKRTRSDLGLESLCSPVKRRSFTLGGSSAPLRLTKGHGSVAATAAAAAAAAAATAAATNAGSTPYVPASCSSSGDEDVVARNRVSEVRKKLNKDLLLAVCRCSDSDMGSGTDLENVKEINDCRKKGVSSRPSSFSSKRNQTPKVDLMARERCFDYIVQSIDEVWARYCDTTSNAEAAVYGGVARRKSATSDALSSSYTHSQRDKALRVVAANGGFSSEIGSDADEEVLQEDSSNSSHTDHFDEGEDEDDANTNATDYETDHSESRTVSNLPDSVKLQSLKSRLTKAKEDLEQVYDSTEYADCCAFWQRWDMAKYSAVEMMEEDDDDELIENIIEELEEGRCYTN
ncbi:hypothetical protein ZYGR_0M00130 [Zygosaccharomyces rouxii]|uniref:Uncharacterized protein n=1 Tax=Zygosaccharomyces rouxii TaxID=4956 RepID=A0A1Q2ZYR9_ZYGRO|nr:hypothetical protein ZYGR_0M00130 [Zygosaccharomyces rouxii]